MSPRSSRFGGLRRVLVALAVVLVVAVLGVWAKRRFAPGSNAAAAVPVETVQRKLHPDIKANIRSMCKHPPMTPGATTGALLAFLAAAAKPVEQTFQLGSR